MANEDQDLEQDLEDDVEEKSGSKMMLIIIIAVVLLGGGGAAAFFLLGGEEQTPADGEAAAEEEIKNKEPPEYIGVPEAITSNLPGKAKSLTVQIKMNFMVRGSDAKEAVKTHMPRLKNDVLMLVSQQTADELRTPEGRTLLQKKSLETVQKTLTDLVGEPMVEKVLFVSFVMQ